MEGRLQGKTVLITAAAQGIGRAIAESSVKNGARVIATDINESGLEQLSVAVPGAEIRRLDVMDPTDIAAAAAADIDVLINCAGFVANGTILECTEEDWDFSWRLNVTSMYRMITSFLPGMVARRTGSIVNIASVASSIVGVPNRFAYGATKAAIIGMTKSVAVDYVKFGVRCNVICPGTVQTPSLDKRIEAFDDPAQARTDFENRQPMGRLGRAEEVAALAVYLASNESAYTTGAVHIIDGGWTAA